MYEITLYALLLGFFKTILMTMQYATYIVDSKWTTNFSD